MTTPRRLALVGAGRAAATLARALLDHGYAVAAVTARRPESAAAAAEFLGGAAIARSNPEAAAQGDVVLIGVPDGAIADVAAEIAAAGVDLRDRVVLHLAGAIDAQVLAALRPLGAAVGSLHPLQTFPERIEERDYLAGVTFAIEGDPAALAVATDMVEKLRGHPLPLHPGAKPLYHAAASVAANHLTALIDLAQRLLCRAGARDPERAFEALLPLVVSTLSAIEARGAGRALTGPIVRGDEATLSRHLGGLSGGDHALYRALARATLDLALGAGRLDPAAAARIEGTLAERPARVVVSLRAGDSDGLAERQRLAPDADLVEHRIDLLAEPLRADVERLARGGRSIVTCRAGATVPADAARRLLLRAISAGAVYVDVELGGEADLPREHLVVSWHGPAAGAAAAATRIAELRPAVGKVVIEATSPGDLLLLPDLARRLRRGCREVAVLASGAAGTASRILARRLDSDWTYACLRLEEATAPGQIPLAELLGRYRVRSVTAGSRVFGLAGDPIAHSLSPAFHNLLLPEAIPGAVYVPFPSGVARDVVELVRGLPVDGLSVTMPLKESIAPLLDELSPEAEATASVNTVLRRGGRLRGENTDVAAIAAVAATLLPLTGKRALVLGAGGAGSAAAFALARAGAIVTIVSRTGARAEAVAKRLGVAAAPHAGDVDWDLLCNCTPLGMAPDLTATPFPIDRLGEGRGRAVLDLIYEPRTTHLAREALARGFAVATGLPVLLTQGQAQLFRFTGRTPTLERLEAALP